MKNWSTVPVDRMVKFMTCPNPLIGISEENR